jgi:hypothetical protein
MPNAATMLLSFVVQNTDVSGCKILTLLFPTLTSSYKIAVTNNGLVVYYARNTVVVWET